MTIRTVIRKVQEANYAYKDVQMDNNHLETMANLISQAAKLCVSANNELTALEAQAEHLKKQRDGALKTCWSLLDAISYYVQREFGDSSIWYDDTTTAHERLQEIATLYGAHDLAEEWQKVMEKSQ